MAKTITEAVEYLSKTFNDINREAATLRFTMDDIESEKAKHAPGSVEHNVLLLMQNSAIVVDAPKKSKKVKQPEETFDEIKEEDAANDYKVDGITDCV